MKILFLDATVSLLARYPVKLLNELKNNYTKSIFISYKTGYDDSNEKKTSIELLKSNKSFYYLECNTKNPKYITRTLKRIKPNIVIFGGYRAPDMLWLAICNKLDIKTIILQHGFDIEHINRSKYSLLSNFKKNYDYCITIYNLSKILKNNPLLMLNDYLKYMVSGIGLSNTTFQNKFLIPSNFYIYSEFYKNLFAKKYGFNKNVMKVTGSIDLYNYYSIINQKRFNAPCYLAQTFVEDNRIPEILFENIIAFYVNLAKEVNIFYLKLHPRSNIDLYKNLTSLSNVIVLRNEFPNCSVYIGHYSSTLFLARYLSGCVIIHDIESETIPKMYQLSATLISKNLNEIKKEIYMNQNILPNLENISNMLKRIAPMPVINPIVAIANEIRVFYSDQGS